MNDERAPPLLSLRDVSVRFGGIVALDGVSFDVTRGTIVGLIGPNGAGKTTLFNCLSRLYQYDHGEIAFDGQFWPQFEFKLAAFQPVHGAKNMARNPRDRFLIFFEKAVFTEARIEICQVGKPQI